MRSWVVVALWVLWLAVVIATGYAQPAAGDVVDAPATRASVRADLLVLLSMALAAGAAVGVPAAAIPGSPWLGVLGGSVLVALGLGLRRWATGALGAYFTRNVGVRQDQQVVSEGPYRYVRHPGYAGLLLSSLGLALVLWNGVSLAVMATGGLVAAVLRVTAEEVMLEARLGQPYRDYEQDRKRLLPGIW